MPRQRAAIGFFTDGKDIVHPVMGGSKSPKMKALSRGEDELHPFVARPSNFEPILTVSQKLTPAQKEHLAANVDRETLREHLVGFHAQVFPAGKESELAHPIDPQVRQRFGLPDRPLTSTETFLLRHIQEHLDNIEERVRTAPRKAKLHLEDFREAGVEPVSSVPTA